MSKNTLYLIATILALVIIALVMSPNSNNAPVQAMNPLATPSTGTAVTPSEVLAPSPDAGTEATPDTGALPPAAAPDATAPATMAPGATGTETDDVPASAEVAPAAPAATPAMPAPADGKAPALPPSEGQ